MTNKKVNTKTGKQGKAAKGAQGLKPDPRNARLHNERNKAVIRSSLEEVGGFRSIAVDGDNIVRAGNGVFEQSQSLGLKVRVVDAAPDEIIAVRRKDLKGKRAERAALLDNRAGETSTWDAAVIEEIAATEKELLAGLFDEDELKEIIARNDEAGNGDADAEPQIDRAAELNKKWQVNRGDLFRIGEHHRLLCGDSLQVEDIEKLVGDVDVKCVNADPPYGVNIVAVNGFVGGGKPIESHLVVKKKLAQSGGGNRLAVKRLGVFAAPSEPRIKLKLGNMRRSSATKRLTRRLTRHLSYWREFRTRFMFGGAGITTPTN